MCMPYCSPHQAIMLLGITPRSKVIAHTEILYSIFQDQHSLSLSVSLHIYEYSRKERTEKHMM